MELVLQKCIITKFNKVLDHLASKPMKKGAKRTQTSQRTSHKQFTKWPLVLLSRGPNECLKHEYGDKSRASDNMRSFSHGLRLHSTSNPSCLLQRFTSQIYGIKTLLRGARVQSHVNRHHLFDFKRAVLQNVLVQFLSKTLIRRPRRTGVYFLLIFRTSWCQTW